MPDHAPLSVELSSGKTLLIGRAEDADVRVEGDLHVSRRHAEVALGRGKLKVRKLMGASNPVYHAGAAKTEFELPPGGSFMIGRTRFTYVDEAAPEPAEALPSAGPGDLAAPTALKTMSVQDLYSMAAGSPLRWSDLLELPEILRSRDRADFYQHLARLLRVSTRSLWACVVSEDEKVLGEDVATKEVSPRFRPSRALLRKALEDAPAPTLYSWQEPGTIQATAIAGLDWAACAAARIPGQPALIFYVAGRETGGAAGRREEARFVGLVADMVGRSLTMDRLVTWEGRLEHFFAGPVVSKILASPDLKELEPRLAASTVMFFDIRGHSRRTEQKNVEILGFIGELRRAMTAMTQIVQDEHGVVLQYVGDGLLACWNVPFEDAAHVDRACRAALAMSQALGRTTGGWTCGIGLHTGEVVAGAIGSEQVFSYGVMGSVVNQCSRLEGLTKILRAPVLATKEVAAKLSPETGAAVRLGRYQPAGMDSALEVFELRASGDPARAATLANGLAAFERGNWDVAERTFSSLGDGDGPASFLRELARHYAAQPPAQWSGVVVLSQK